jgi:ribonuclease VapC
VIVVDASALLAVYFREPECEAFLDVLLRAEALVMSPVNLWEVLARAHSVHGEAGLAQADVLIDELAIAIAPPGRAEVAGAVAAFARFGRRTAAGLNLGDCFAYALAVSQGAPLLFKGDDFAKTDVMRV